jgi:acyl-coenzyme A thioesterase PaaI-like protein
MTDEREAREHLADAVRGLIEQLVDSDAPPEDLERGAKEVEQLAASLEPHPRRGPKHPNLPDLQRLQEHFWRDPVIGRSNPVAPPIDIEVEDGLVRGRVRLGLAYEGPPGYAHGAVIAGAFDQILGLANLASGNVGMTGTLKVRYRRPTPLHTDLLIEGWADHVEGRKIYTEGRLLAGDKVTAEAEGVFVNLLYQRAVELFPRRKQA